MRYISLLLFLLISGFSFSQNSNRFEKNSSGETVYSNFKDEDDLSDGNIIKEQNPPIISNRPGNPGELPINHYIPVLLIAASIMIVYFSRKKSKLNMKF